MKETDHGLVPITPEGYEAMQKELDELLTVKRPEIAERIRDSLSHGEFSEDNSELDEVKREQAMVETRIGTLKATLANAQVLDPEAIPTDRVGIGSFVQLEDEEFGEVFSVRVVSSAEADPNQDRISNESPLGAAVLNLTVGQVAEFDTPDGPKRFKILKIDRRPLT
ncbi:MAG: transcription elongation factor GreA [Fimbriimonadales bacterium]|nr:transcription elongation factor GreA [Fimbriimonadales bacterium]